MNVSQSMDNVATEKKRFICGVVEGFYGKPWTCLQRRDLFKKLKDLKLNAFMYAPKDDTKHRAKWRQLYTEAEAHELKTLIDEATANEIDFYYSLAPGLDMVYSSHKDTTTLCQKFDQIRQLGCKSFAILFDDIEPHVINEEDKGVFHDDYASAQVLVTNLIYEYLDKPNFMFCPTEYCESRAVPNVLESSYLNTIGSGLHKDIDIMWSGSRVISRFITEESIRTLNSVIKRPPVIWENLHANDYDKKRVYLGPYSGRSTKIIPQLRGVLTNPNCEYEANHVAIHTLAQWSRCTEDANPLNRCNQERQAIEVSDVVYDPDRALNRALLDWLPHLLSTRSLPLGGDLNRLSEHRNDELASNQLLKENEQTDDGENVIEVENENFTQPTTTHDPNEISTSSSEMASRSDMDTSSSPLVNVMVDTNSCESCEMKDATEQSIETTTLKDSNTMDSGNILVIQSNLNPNQQDSSINLENLALIVDFFYLPFEHGTQGHNFISEIRWLINNSDVFILHRDFKTNDINENEATMTDDELSDIDQNIDGKLSNVERSKELWIERAERMRNLCGRVSGTVDSFIQKCPNKLLIAELYPYLLDLREMILMIVDFIQFLQNRKSDLDHFLSATTRSSRSKEVVSCDEQEPWVHRGGLIGDIHRIISHE